jgi:D-beta-D-heptose 7-phosphate kinase/D-beta-D-heptose 1-phosphate adenosyltransferase
VSDATRIDPGRLRAILAGIEGKTLLVVGDVMLDRYLWGNVSRISPEAPVPVVEVESETTRLGGAANVAHNVLALRARPRLVGAIGDDGVAGRLREELSRAGVAADHLVVDARRTTQKTRIVARGQHVVRADEEDRSELDAVRSVELAERAVAGLAGAAAVIIADYGKGVVTAELLGRLLPAARERGLPVCVDPKDTHFFSYLGVSVITPNQHEAAEVLGYKLRSEDAVSRAGAELLERLASECVLITRGEKGMSLFERDGGTRSDFPAMARTVYDVTGAGDTVVGTYAAALAGGAAPREAALIANHAAGLVVAELGTAVPGLAALSASFGAEAR